MYKAINMHPSLIYVNSSSLPSKLGTYIMLIRRQINNFILEMNLHPLLPIKNGLMIIRGYGSSHPGKVKPLRHIQAKLSHSC
jgi:hypothetical protein